MEHGIQGHEYQHQDPEFPERLAVQVRSILRHSQPLLETIPIYDCNGTKVRDRL
jgi:hypothetical protein